MTKPTHINALDGLRGIAILLVLAAHFFHFSYGWMGVDLFFGLSGFLITGILLDAKSSDSHFFRNFYARRMLRIFPVYYGILIFAFFIAQPFFHLLTGEELNKYAWGLWLYCSNFVEAFHHKDIYGCFDHFWSLAVEEHFYFIWPLLVWCVSRRTLAVIAATGFCLMPVIHLLFLHAGLDYDKIYLLTPCRVDGLMLGGLLAIFWRSRHRQSTGKFQNLFLACAVAAFLPLVLITSSSYSSLFGISIGFSIVAIGSIALTLAALKFGGSRIISITLGSRPLRWFGKYSYGIYAFHPFIFYGTWIAFGRLHLQSNAHADFAFRIISLIVSLAVAYTSFHIYEKHFLKLKRFFEVHPPLTATPQTASPAS